MGKEILKVVAKELKRCKTRKEAAIKLKLTTIQLSKLIKENPGLKKILEAKKTKIKNERIAKAKRGNQFWRVRSKHGRDFLFKTPESMLKACFEYFEWIENNPLYEAVLHQKTTELISVPKMRPFTMQGLCGYLGCSSNYFRNFKYNLEKREKAIELSNKDRDFLAIIARVEDIIYRQKFEGAASGFLNANIICRDLGLADKQAVAVKVDKLSEFFGGVNGELSPKT